MMDQKFLHSLQPPTQAINQLTLDPSDQVQIDWSTVGGQLDLVVDIELPFEGQPKTLFRAEDPGRANAVAELQAELWTQALSIHRAMKDPNKDRQADLNAILDALLILTPVSDPGDELDTEGRLMANMKLDWYTDGDALTEVQDLPRKLAGLGVGNELLLLDRTASTADAIGVGDFVTAKLRSKEDCRQGWITRLQIQGESGMVYDCEGVPTRVKNPPVRTSPHLPVEASPSDSVPDLIWFPMGTAPKDQVILLWFPPMAGWGEGPWRGSWSATSGSWGLHAPFLTGGKPVMLTDPPVQPTKWCAFKAENLVLDIPLPIALDEIHDVQVEELHQFLDQVGVSRKDSDGAPLTLKARTIRWGQLDLEIAQVIQQAKDALERTTSVEDPLRKTALQKIAEVQTAYPVHENTWTFQRRAATWVLEAFGHKGADDKRIRAHRFFEEASELVQACGVPELEAVRILSYVYNRQVGDRGEEVGDVMVTLAGLCYANGLDMHLCSDRALDKGWSRIEAIRERHSKKPKFEPPRFDPVLLVKSLVQPSKNPRFGHAPEEVKDFFLEMLALDHAVNHQALTTRTSRERDQLSRRIQSALTFVDFVTTASYGAKFQLLKLADHYPPDSGPLTVPV